MNLVCNVAVCLLSLAIVVEVNSKNVGFIDGPCDCSQTSNVQCWNLKNFENLQQMMNNARRKVQLAGLTIMATMPYVQSVSVYQSKIDSKDLPNVFSGTNPQYIRIIDCSISGLFDDNTGKAFVGVGSRLDELKISRSKLDISKWADMSNLVTLRTLILSEDEIEVISNGLFSSPPENLKRLLLYNNRLKSLPDKAFVKLGQLQELDLSGNKIQSIARSMFPPGDTQLQKIYLEENELKYLPTDIFEGMPKLDTINLNHNRLTTLDRPTWVMIWTQLKYIFLQGNEWDCTCQKMGWLTKPQVRLATQTITGSCSAPAFVKSKKLEDITDVDIACDLHGRLS